MADRAAEPFQFREVVVQVELTGRRARTLRELTTLLGEVTDASIFFHMHHFFLRHYFELPDYTNDFSNWVARAVEDRALAEKLANIAPFQFASVAQLRGHIRGVITAHTTLRPEIADLRVEPFYFDTAVTLVFSGETVHSLGEFRSTLTQIEPSTVYYHVYESRLRGGQATDDFSNWIERCFDAPGLVREIRGVDPYMHSLEGLRSLIVKAIDAHAPQAKFKGGG